MPAPTAASSSSNSISSLASGTTVDALAPAARGASRIASAAVATQTTAPPRNAAV